MQIAVIGTGYVGLVSGVCFAEYGFRVTCVDKDANKIAHLQQQIMPIYEPGLEQLVEANRRAGRLSFSTDLKQAVAEADVVMIAVGTPQNDTDAMPDLAALEAAVAQVAQALAKYTVVVIKSTVPIGTNARVTKMIASANPSADFDVVSNPEFLREGAAIQDFMTPDRVVIGVDSLRAREVMQRLYAPICVDNIPLLSTSFESAEMIKYASNSLLATKITFVNEIADLCEKTGANIRDVARGIGMDQRIGDKFLQPGPGYGGSCFPKDTMALAAMARTHGTPSRVVEATIASNDARKIRMAEKIIAACGGNVSGKTIAILGVTFKPATDDMRESASLTIIPMLQAAGATVRAYDPQGMEEAKKLLADVAWCPDSISTVQGADALVVLTEWNEFRNLNLTQIKSLMKAPVIVDLRNIYKRLDMKRLGFHYVSIGRQDVHPGEPFIADLKIEDEKV
ncbi:MAG: UDP-glucose/GDP-mannose dehydrogenase family protein [Alphaproteobacteria bacterium]|nr:UDP-glucose/GDP-mannose dehydrogenase family protein [Alphaproteobacteria bacterium]